MTARLIAFCGLVLGFACPASGATFALFDGAVTVSNWGYVLQGPGGTLLQSGPLAAADHHLLVMDFAQDGMEATKFNPTEIAAIRNSSPSLGGDGHRKVLCAYVSIGEASEFRSYWDPSWTQDGTADSPLTATAPSWLGPVNPAFPESRKVRFWDPGWQSLIFNAQGTGWLDQVVTQGFDSVYLDIIDAFFFWGAEATPGQLQPGDPVDLQDSARRMIDFVVALTLHARQTSPAFFAIPQNGEFVLDDADFGGPLPADPVRRAAYLNAIGATGIEDTYFVGSLDENNIFDPDLAKVGILQQDFLAAGIPVFVVDYISDPAKVAQFYTEALADGFIPYAAPSRGLDIVGEPVPVPEPALPILLAAGLATLPLLKRLSRRTPRCGR